MKVKELIKRLQEFDEDMEIEIGYTNQDNCYYANNNEEVDKTIESVQLDEYGYTVLILDGSRS